MARTMQKVGPFALRKGGADSELQALVRSIVYQQLSGTAAATIYGRLLALFDDEFPAAEVLVETHHARLRKAGLSRNKQAAIKDLCRHAISGRLPLGRLSDLRDAELVERLVEVRGIGVWSAQMFMIFHLGRLDVWPAGDLGVRKGVARLVGTEALPGRSEMERIGAGFAPYRTIAAWYMWRSLEQ
jgi:3-methyladenine DNA glycosylase/8-oxoguanine DNA glycosylase